MKRTGTAIIATGAVGLVALLATGVVPAVAATARPAVAPGTGQLLASSAISDPQPARAVIVIGVAGLRWTDITAATTPDLWKLAEAGSVGTLATTTIYPVTCPVDGWLTLNAGARAAERRQPPSTPLGPCPALPAVQPASPAHSVAGTAGAAGTNGVGGTGGTNGAGGTGGSSGGATGAPGPARIAAMAGLIRNQPVSYSPDWGALAQAAGPGRCATAVGPGAALALANPAGNVQRYWPALPGASRFALDRFVLGQCPLTVIDLGALPGPGAAAAGAAGATAAARDGTGRVAALGADDLAVGRIVAAAPAGAIIVLASTGDEPGPHLGVVVVHGPGYRAGLLTSISTRQPGVAVITDLTPSIFSWLGTPIPPAPKGAAAPDALTLRSAGRGPLATVVKTLIGQDTADQVYRSIVGWFFLFYGIAEAVLFALIAVVLRGSGEERVRRRVTAYSIAATFSGAVPVGTFLAGVVPWAQLPHPALLLYGLGFAWAAVIAAVAMTGPWRRDPFGPPGFVAAITLAVIAVDVMTGSRLQIGAPFGLSLLEAGRFYGVGNNAVCIYATAGILTATWAAVAVSRRGAGSGGGVASRRGVDPLPSPVSRWGVGSQRAATAAAGGVALVTVVASGWPGFGAKVGGTIAMVPAFGVLLAAVAGVRITWRRGLLIAVSGLLLVTAFAVLDYLIPGIGASHLGGFVGQVRQGDAGSTLQRKISSNLGSLFLTWYTPVVPVVAVVTGLMLARPARFRLRTMVSACARSPLLRTSLFAVWLAVVLGWMVDDSGVSVAAAALPIALPLTIAIVIRVANLPAEPDSGERTVGRKDQASLQTG